jgi:hypothetical protein
MAEPSSRAQLKEYCLRKLGKPVIEINVDDDQIEDLIDDTLQLYRERSYDGVERVYLKYKLTSQDIANAKAYTSTTYPSGLSFSEASGGFLTMPDHILGVQGIFKISNAYVNNMFGFRYQFFLNDFYNFYAYDLLNYYITMTYLETLDFMLEGNKSIRFHKTQNRLTIDLDWSRVQPNDWLVIECFRALDPTQFTKIYNEIFVKKHLTSTIKRQWGQNLIKFEGIQMPGGVTFNGRQIYDDAIEELRELEEKMSSTYELPPLDMIG